MIMFVVKRLAYTAIVLVLVSLVVFGATHVLPGSAANLLLGENASLQDLATLERQLGLDRPFYIQYGAWLWDFVRGDWGYSLTMQQPASALVALRFQNSAILVLFCLILVILIAIPLGVIAAVRRGSLLDLSILSVSYIGISVPEFVIGIALILIFAGPELALLPAGGYSEISKGFGAWLQHLILPTATLTLVLIAHVVRQTRSGMIDVLRENYIRTAVLKGASYRHVVVHHGLRNGLVPAITIIAIDIGYLMGSIVIVEEVFSYPGLGRLIVSAVQGRDVIVLEAAILIIAITYSLANLAADVLHTYLDPRIRYQ